MASIASLDEVSQADLKSEKFEYLEALCKESLRFHPPGYFLMPRIACHDGKIGDIPYKKGDKVNFFMQAHTRNPEYFKNPDQFIPERWLDGSTNNIHPVTF